VDDEIQPIDIEQTAIEWAVPRASHALFSTVRGWLGLGFGLLVGVVVTLDALPSDWSEGNRTVMTTLGGLAGGLLVIVGVYIGATTAAPRAQREEARNRLTRIKKAREEYALSAVGSVNNPSPKGGSESFIDLRVNNDGRPAWFSVVIEGIDGADKELIDPFARLYWKDRPAHDPQEWPRGEERTIGVATIFRPHGGFAIKPMSADGPRTGGQMYLLPEDGLVKIRVRVTARNDPAVEFYQRFVVPIRTTPGGYSLETATTEPPFQQPLTNLDRLLEF